MVLEGVWEAKILDFRTFFIIFSMQNFDCNLEGQKIEKNCQQERSSPILGSILRYVRPWGEGFRKGGKPA